MRARSRYRSHSMESATSIDFGALEAAVGAADPPDRAHVAIEPARLGRRLRTSSAGCSTSAAAAASGCSRTRCTSASTTAAPPAPRRHPSCGCATATTRARRAVLLEDLLHDGLARRLARQPCGRRAEARPAERVLRLPRRHLHADRGADRAPRGRGGARPHGRRAEGEARALPLRAARAARRHGAGARGRLLRLPANRRARPTRSRSAGGCSSKRRVGLAPGSAFGAGGEGSVRICYAAERSVLEPALERLERFVAAGAL